MTETVFLKAKELSGEMDELRRMIKFLENENEFIKDDLDIPLDVELHYKGGQKFYCSGKFIAIDFPDIEMLKEDLLNLEKQFSELC